MNIWKEKDNPSGLIRKNKACIPAEAEQKLVSAEARHDSKSIDRGVMNETGRCWARGEKKGMFDRSRGKGEPGTEGPHRCQPTHHERSLIANLDRLKEGHVASWKGLINPENQATPEPGQRPHDDQRGLITEMDQAALGL